MKRHDQEQMLSLYDQWQASGESKKDFAVKHSIRPTTFYYWARKFEQSSASGFRRISIEDTPLASQGGLMAAIHYPSGVRLELYAPFQGMAGSGMRLLKELIE